MADGAALDPGELIARARRLLTTPAPQADVVAAAQTLMRFNKWLDAAALWEIARSAATTLREPRVDTSSIAQQALCISKEKQQLKADEAFARAVEVLTSGDLATTADQETLGIAGGIYKRYWDTFRQPEHLQQAFTYYERGWNAGGVNDDGYTGVNAAYVADVLAYTEETIARRAGAPSPTAPLRRLDARRIREAIVAKAPALLEKAGAMNPMSPARPADHPWWILVTLAEAHFGLAFYDGAHYSPAEQYLGRALGLTSVPEWMIETTARQLGAMARMQASASATAGADPRPWQVLDVLVRRVPGLRTELGGKVGLALSGGGFRASLFHIGVLARLAELDLLRHVEVLSCVSGGSILGAVYYLKLRALLSRKRDDQISRDDYLTMVGELETEFVSRIQRNNFRLRMLERFSANWAMLKNRRSRTEVLGRVMGRELCGSDEVYMDEVAIRPPDGEPGFEAADHNWRRRSKVPLLVLNATNQAGGHPWHFTPYEMGEPQRSRVDSNPQRRRRAYRPDLRVHMWRAVVASACVPVLFEPVHVPFDTGGVNLLDGGVHDNQGTSALLEHDCTLLLVSDASGQLSDDPSASTSFAAVGLRADAIVQERLRIALYDALESRRKGSLLRGMMFLHLRLGLGARDDELTSYGVPTGIQRRISDIRTDLDVFNDAEALSLILSGYLMARDQFQRQLPDVQGPAPTEQQWRFRTFEPKLTAPGSRDRLVAALDLAAAKLLKAWRAVPLLKWTGRIVIALAAAGALWLLIALLRSETVIQVRTIGKFVVGALIAFVIERVLRIKMPSWKQEAAFAATALLGAAIAWVHARWLDPAYLRAGHRDRI